MSGDELTRDADHEVDSRGRLCPLPVIDLARAARQASPGDLIDLVADDPAAAGDVAAWCTMRHHTLLSSAPFDEAEDEAHAEDLSYREATVYRIRINP